MTDIVFYFDFGSPNAYLAHRVIPGIERRTGSRFVYEPVLLGGLFKLTGNQAPMMAFANIPKKLAYEHLEMRRFIQRHGLTAFRMNPFFPVNTLRLMRMAVAAQADGILPAYVEAVFHFMWEDPRKMDDPAVVEAALTEAGLDAAHLMARGEAPEIKALLMAKTEAAAEKGAFGIPSFLVGNDLYFGKDRLRDIEEAVAG